MHNKKAVEMGMNVIVIAAIALVVLVVLLAIFTGRINLFGKGVQSSEKSAYATLCQDPVRSQQENMEYVCSIEKLDEKPGENWAKKSLPYGASWSDCQYICYQRVKLVT